MDRIKFEKAISEALKEFPADMLEKLKNVAIVYSNKPSQYQKKQLGCFKDVLILGLYEGIPQIKRGGYNKAMPDKITLFRHNIEIVAQGNKETIKKIIKETIWHEVAHHFGMDEKEIQKTKQKEKYEKNIHF